MARCGADAARLAAAIAFGWLIATGTVHAQLSADPPAPTTLDTVRLRYTHVGCSDPSSVQVSQESNRITVQVNRIFAIDCGTVAGAFEDFTLGRLPSGEYDVTLVVNPPPGTLGPSQLVGPLHVSIGAIPAGPAHPHDDYSAMWWNAAEPGWALTVTQSAETLFMVWVTYDEAGRPTWFVVPGGTWGTDAANRLRFAGSVYRTTGPSWQGPFDPAAVVVARVGTASFTPSGPGRAQFDYDLDGIASTKSLERMRF